MPAVAASGISGRLPLGGAAITCCGISSSGRYMLLGGRGGAVWVQAIQEDSAKCRYVGHFLQRAWVLEKYHAKYDKHRNLEVMVGFGLQMGNYAEGFTAMDMHMGAKTVFLMVILP